MQIENDLKLDFKDVLIKPKRSVLTSRSQVNLHRNYKFLHSKKTYAGVPIIAANMDTIGTFEMADALAKHGLSTAIHKHYTTDNLAKFFLGGLTPEDVMKVRYSVAGNETKHWFSMGITDKDLEKYNAVEEKMRGFFPAPMTGFINVCIDVANGYQEAVVDFVKKFREDHPITTIMAGNVVTSEMTEALILAGADIVKVGIGSGSVCTTRIKAGVGMPQLSAIIECADAAHGLKAHICADGGIVNPGDLGKAFGAGADFIMLGGMLAGHDECGGEIIYRTWTEKKGLGVYVDETNTGDQLVDVELHEPIAMKFYGMSSKEAMDKHNGGVAKHRAAEGKCVEVPYKGKVEGTIQEILGGLRSTATYIGAESLKEFGKRTTFIRVNSQSNEIFGKN